LIPEPLTVEDAAPHRTAPHRTAGSCSFEERHDSAVSQNMLTTLSSSRSVFANSSKAMPP
jgi:hypothetical protein